MTELDAGIIAALCLPFERFAGWCGAWLKPKHRERRHEAVKARLAECKKFNAKAVRLLGKLALRGEP